MKKRSLLTVSFICLALCTLLYSCADPEEDEFSLFGT